MINYERNGCWSVLTHRGGSAGHSSALPNQNQPEPSARGRILPQKSPGAAGRSGEQALGGCFLASSLGGSPTPLCLSPLQDPAWVTSASAGCWCWSRGSCFVKANELRCWRAAASRPAELGGERWLWLVSFPREGLEKAKPPNRKIKKIK